MKQYAPELDMDEDYNLPAFSNFRSEGEIMELLWQNGQVVVQNQRHSKKSLVSPKATDSVLHLPPQPPPPPSHNQRKAATSSQLLIREDETASWLHLPLEDSAFDRDIYTDFLYPPPPPSPQTTSAAMDTSLPADVRPSISLTAQISAPQQPMVAPKPPVPRGRNFPQFYNLNGKMTEKPTPSGSARNEGRESTVVESNITPAIGPQSCSSFAERYTMGASGGERFRHESLSGDGAAGASTAGGLSQSYSRDVDTTFDVTMTSSPGGSGASATETTGPNDQQPMVVDRKRKGRAADANTREAPSEDVEIESAKAKKLSHGPRRPRAAEVHNLSERRRRDRINEKMKALQELIPHCSKTDKASMLDEAIDYLKTLQMQVQMMSMGCSMLPMMFPGVHPHMNQMRMGMGMGMGINQPMMPFPSVLGGPSIATPPPTHHLGPQFPLPAFSMPHVPLSDPSRAPSSNQMNSMMNPYALQSSNFQRPPNMADPYQQYLSMQQLQAQVPQPHPASEPSTSKNKAKANEPS